MPHGVSTYDPVVRPVEQNRESTATRRTSTVAVRPLSEQGEQLLRDLLDASAGLWNRLNYERPKIA
jgi:hypothetical protein